MDNENQLLQLNTPGKRRWRKWIGWLLIGLIILGAAFWLWRGYFSPAAKSERETRKNYEKYLAWEKNYTDAMKADTYGGKTPEETLKMFIEALEKSDIELASKYFALNTNENSKYYLTRKEWEEGLRKAQQEERLEEIINKIKETKPMGYLDSYGWYKKSFSFESLNKDGIVETLVELVFNHLSGVWKIESI